MSSRQPGMCRSNSAWKAGLVQVAADAVGTYDPEREAIVLESRYEAVNVVLVSESEVVTLGTLAFVDPS